MTLRDYFSKLIFVFKRDGFFFLSKRSLNALIFNLRKSALHIIFPSRIPGNQLKKWIPQLSALPIEKRHWEVTLLHSVDYSNKPPGFLIETAFNACRRAASSEAFAPVVSRLGNHGEKAAVWPGEHYRLLTALVEVTGATRVIEIGTYHGVGALSLSAGFPAGSGRVITYDVIPWFKFPESSLRHDDFKTGNIEQRVGDLTNDAYFYSQRPVFESTDIIFMDAAKDGEMERRFLKQFSKCYFKKRTLLIIDDIRLWNMLKIWDEITWPKLDISGFGHYTGTGLVELSSCHST